MNTLLSRVTILIIIGICFAANAFGQGNITVTGKITQSGDNAPLPGVNVVVRGTGTGAIADAEGNYSISSDPNAMLVFSFVGFTTQEIRVGGRSTINVQLEPLVTELNQVVVTGYNTSQKREIISSIVSVSPDAFKNMPVSGLDQALQGQAAGVLVQQSSGTPGGGIMVRVRGNTSISASNRPLFIVDGMPVASGALGYSLGGQTDNALATINPNDIESIEVLKDASAKAIYGSRGANGVVLITTKRGKNNTRTVLQAEVQRGMIDISRRPKMLNATQLLELQREAVTNAGGNPDAQGLVPGVTDAVNTNWLDEVLRRSIYEQYQVSASGGTERTRFYLSGAYRGEEGVQLNNRFDRFTGALNLDHKASEKLSFGSNLTLARTKNIRLLGDNALAGPYRSAVNSLPYYHPYNEQGKIIVANAPGWAGFPNSNPVAEALLPRYETYTTKILGGLFAQYAIRKDLQFRSQVSVDFNSVIEDIFQPATTLDGSGDDIGNRGLGLFTTRSGATIVNTNTLTYNRTVGKDHSLSGLLGTEVLQATSRSSSVQGRLFVPDFTYISSAGVVDAGSSGLGRNGLFSVFGEAKYDFREKYLASVTLRTDGSSRFGQNRRFGFFPSLSAGWRISAEPFMERYNTFLDDLKLRGSYGFTGNERIPSFAFLGTWSSRDYNGVVGTGPDGPGNPNLQWERTREANLGLDVSLFNGRIGTIIEVYSNYTDELLFTEPFPATTGFGGIQGNVGSISNRGVEWTLKTVNVDKTFKWSTNLNISRNVNKVEELASEEPLLSGYDVAGSSATHVVTPGQPLGTFWGLNFLGVDAATGDAIYEDSNRDGQITSADAKAIGNAQPDFYGGLTNVFSYKNFGLDLFFQFSYGNEILNLSKLNIVNAGQDLQRNQSVEALKRWRQPGDITSVPRYEQNNTINNYQSTRFVEDGSYARLKNITLSYNLGQKLVSRFRIENARIYASATNLWLLTNYSGPDPEVSTLDGSTTDQGTDYFTFPQVKTVMLGLSIGF